MKTMRIGLIGTGSIVENFINACNKIDNIEINSLYTRDKNSERANFFKNHYKISNIYDNLDSMLENKDINFIYVASPNSLHYEQSLKALMKNKNVICEKPFTSTKQEALHLLDTAQKNNLMIFEGITTIHLPNFKLIKESLHNLGQIKIVQMNFSQYSSKYDLFLEGKKPNVFNKDFSGGALQDINIYNIHFIVGLFGFPKESIYYPNIKEGIDTSGIITMKYENFVGTLIGSKDTKSENFVYIQGENGFLKVNSSSSLCTSVQIHINKNETSEILNLQEESNVMYYEMLEFKNIFESNNLEKANELAKYSIDIVGLVEGIRLKSNIIFPADLK